MGQSNTCTQTDLIYNCPLHWLRSLACPQWMSFISRCNIRYMLKAWTVKYTKVNFGRSENTVHAEIVIVTAEPKQSCLHSFMYTDNQYIVIYLSMLFMHS